MAHALPSPGVEARAVSDALRAKIQQRCESQQGCLPFDSYMDLALYEPGLGYYSNGLTPFGEAGDFITAPESGALFARCLARAVGSVLQQLDQAWVLELGAGSGALARSLLPALEALDCLPARYCILERSASMRALQEAALAQIPHLAGRVEWLQQVPAQPFEGVILGNEVADALPVRLFCWRDGEVMLKGVSGGESLGWCTRPADGDTEALVRGWAADYGWSGVYTSEYCPPLRPWVRDLAQALGRGALLLIDYGYGRPEYYHPQRSMGTLSCHYRHQVHDDPLRFPGLQDITAFVDFTAVAEAATGAGLRMLGYSSQAQFLLACGIDRLLAALDPDDVRSYLPLSNEAKRLLLPGEMGERFKVMGYSRDLERDVVGFTPRDLRGRL